MEAIILNGIKAVLGIISDEIQAQLIQLASDWRRERWRIGDIANYVKASVYERGLDVSIMDVYKAIALCLNQEISARTVEYYSSLSEFFDYSIRDEFGELPHSHFAAARKFGDRWREVLELSASMMGQYGRPPSVEWLTAEFSKDGYTPPEPECTTIDEIRNYDDDVVVISGHEREGSREVMLVVLDGLYQLREHKMGEVVLGLVNALIRELERRID